MVLFQMVHNEKPFRRCSVRYWTFSESPTWSDIFPLYSKKKWKADVYWPKIVTYTVNIVKFLVHIISKHPLKAISLIFETGTVGPCLYREVKLGEGAWPPAPFPHWLRPCFCWALITKDLLGSHFWNFMLMTPRKLVTLHWLHFSRILKEPL